MPHPPSITMRPFHEADTAFFTGMASDERVTRFIGDDQPWDEQIIQERCRAALQEDPLDSVGAPRWLLSLDANEPVDIVVSSRKDAGVDIGPGSPRTIGAAASPESCSTPLWPAFQTFTSPGSSSPAWIPPTRFPPSYSPAADSSWTPIMGGLDHYILVSWSSP